MGHANRWVAGALALVALAGPPRLTASSAVLMDWQTGRILFAKEAFRVRPPASLTKVLTALLTLEYGRLGDAVEISSRAARVPGSTLRVRPGDLVTLEELLQAILLSSANDAAVAAAEHLAGSVEEFARLMNRRARDLGATSSRFANPHGLTQPGHYSTAYDLALLARHALNDPYFARLVAMGESEVEELEGDWERHLRNTNRLLWRYPGADGVKTGTTAAAGRCLIASATRDEHRLLVVLLNARDRYGDAARLLDWGFETFTLLVMAQSGAAIATLPVAGGERDRVHLTVDRDLWAVVPRGDPEPPQVILWLPERARAPVQAGEALGRAQVLHGGEVVDEARLVATNRIAGRSLLGAGWGVVLPLIWFFARLGVG
ncbi:MAG: D-alanyl-D-alanine carboxypeptidase family protein [bacterium]|nr:D-alanyl-D-alanine carboxypeptidase family protein [bacterium]